MNLTSPPELLARLRRTLDGRYVIERELGHGAMAYVYLAHEVKHRRPVALKVLRPDVASSVGSERFLREIRCTADLQHPHILQLHDSGEADGLVYYTMPYVPGESLRDRLIRETQLPVSEAIALIRTLGGALAYAHQRGVIHRDIKPENILLQDGVPLLGDFGIAFTPADGERLTDTGLAIGTVHYMSPEQAAGERTLGPESDVYSLAAVAYEMLAGTPPFTGGTTRSIIARLLAERPRSIRAVRPAVSPAIDAAILRALSKEPADRFHSAADFSAALSPATDRAWRTRPSVFRRHAWQVATAVLLVLVLGRHWPISSPARASLLAAEGLALVPCQDGLPQGKTLRSQIDGQMSLYSGSLGSAA